MREIAIGGPGVPPGVRFTPVRIDDGPLTDHAPRPRTGVLCLAGSSGRVDAAILAASFHNPDLRRSLMARDGLVVLARQDHPIVRGRSLSLSRYLASEHIAVIGDSTHPIEEDVALSRSGQARRVRIRTQRYVAAMAIVAESDLLVTMPRFYALVVNRYTRNRMVPFPVRTEPIEYYLYWHASTEADSGVRWLREEIGRSFRKHGSD